MKEKGKAICSLLLAGNLPIQASLHLRAAEAERLGTVVQLICLLFCNDLVDDVRIFWVTVQGPTGNFNGPWLQADKNLD